MKKKVIFALIGSVGGIVVIGLVILVPVLMVLDFFGVNSTDGYVENNSTYSAQYLEVANKYISSNQGYVSLERILYFALADESLTYDEIYKDNLDSDTLRMLPISEVCLLSKYKVLDVCKEDNLSESGQLDEYQNKPFAPPIDFTKVTVTSYFMQERVIYGKANVHGAWDLAASAKTPVYSVCDGTVTLVDFPYATNSIDTSDTQGGNIIKISCEVDDLTYEVLYAHLYPSSAKVSVGDTVTKGQEIAGVGTTGYSTGNHLHFQVTLNGSKVDGMSLIDFTYENDYESTSSRYDILDGSTSYYDNPLN